MTEPAKLAGRFSCHAPPGYSDQHRRILYIGKATMGDFAEENAVVKYFNHKPTGFWSFARKIGRLANPDMKNVEGENLSNVAWSNIFKQGVAVGNPTGVFALRQQREAVDALRDEVLQLKPTLIVSANANDYEAVYEDIIRRAFHIQRDSPPPAGMDRTTVADVKWDIWSRPAYETFPPIVWMYHPERKPAAYTDAALDVIKNVAGW